MSFFSKFKYTNKGPHSLGGKNSNNIGIRYRGLHPSYLGYIDILVCGNSDPGTSGLLSPYSKINGLYFDESDEPDDVSFKLSKDIEAICKEDGVQYIKLDFENKDDYFNMMMELNKFSNENITLYGTSREGHYEVVIDNTADLDEESTMVTMISKKKKKPEETEAVETTEK